MKFPKHVHQNCDALLPLQVQQSCTHVRYSVTGVLLAHYKISQENQILSNSVNCGEVVQYLKTLCDVYDGRIWKEFMNPDGRPFLSAI